MRGAILVLMVGTLLTPYGRSEPALARQTITRHFTPTDRVSGRYQYVPFEVPRGATQVRISYQYDKAAGANVVDLGLFEPGPLTLGTPAFRGYSGGAKSEVSIATDQATPGYVPGPLPPGTWHVLLGLYRVAEAGVDVTVLVETVAGGAGGAGKVAGNALSVGRPARSTTAEARWYVGALHTHTVHSDGTVTPPQLMQRFRDAAFDFVAITDHNNTTHTNEGELFRDASPLWIVGEEVTTPAGHASVWGLSRGDWIDFRVGKGDARINDVVAAARRRGAIFSINHPTSECLGCAWEHDIVDGIEGIEVSNGRHGEVEAALARWDAVLRTGRRLTGVGSSDWHSAPNPIDVAHARVYASALTQEAILDGIRAGRVIVMLRRGDATPDIHVRLDHQRAGVGESISVRGPGPATVDIKAPSLAHGRAVVVTNGERAAPVPLDGRGELQTTVPTRPGYLRIELFDAGNALIAITNPVYFERS